MASVVTEHVILLIPVFVVMMVFALVANSVVSNYAMQQKALVIESAENQFITTISQLYFTLSQSDIPNCIVTKTVPLPEMIENQQYTVNGTLKGNLLTLTFSFPGIPSIYNAVVNLGPKAQWVSSSVFSSTKPNSVIRVEKYYNATVASTLVKFSFG
jgi:hypothetical protein